MHDEILELGLDIDFDLDLTERQPAGWMLVDPRTRLFRCPIAGCVVAELDRAFHAEWHSKIAR